MNKKWVGFGVLGLAILGVVYLFQKFSAKPGEKGPAYTLGSGGVPSLAQDPNAPQSITTPKKGSLGVKTNIVASEDRWTGNILYRANTMPTGNPQQTQNPIDWGDVDKYAGVPSKGTMA